MTEEPENLIASNPEPASATAKSEEPVLSNKETREIVTPYAFGVADALLGQPLATPLRRLVAQLIDISIVAMLSSAHAFVLACFAAVTFFKAGSHLAKGTKRTTARKLLRFSAACLLFMVTYSIVDSYNGSPVKNIGTPDSTNQWAEAGLGLAQQLAWRACEDNMDCYKEIAADFGEAMADTGMSKSDFDRKLQAFFNDKDIDAQTRAELSELYTAAFDALQEPEAQGDNADEGTSDKANSDNTTLQASTVPTPPSTKKADEPVVRLGLGNDNNTQRSQSIIGWVEGIIRDLGLGFGWAALYYSVLTAWWRGHTIGKKLLRIKVVKLDGSPLNLWESFGRYGGYGAGIATGLLGFFQVFWDPNRQTIQDKIAETLVLYRPVGAIPIPQLLEEAQHFEKS